ncbi:MAG: trigger factor, partial [Paludibacteraceae bacterium]|nr:trigger factor [Paludibacteraceae bacterium]
DIDFDTQEDFEFLFDIALAPEVTTKLTEKDKVPYYEISVDDKMINDQVDMFTRRFGQYIQAESVEENDVLKGKMIEMENGAVKENGIVVEDATLSPLHMKEDAQKQLFLNANKEADVVFNPQTAFAGSEVEIASLLKLKKEEVKELNSDFTFHIEGITRYQAAEVNQELFDKVYGEGAVADEAAFRAKVAEGIANDLKQEGAYRFGIDAKALLMKKNQKVAFPEEFLKRWLLATNEKMTQETLDKDFPAMLDELKWQLIKDKLAADNKIEVKEEDVQEYAKYVAKMQFAQYGITGVEDAILENYAKEMMNNKDQVRGMLERVLENKVFELVKGLVKLENKTISMEQLQELYK